MNDEHKGQKPQTYKIIVDQKPYDWPKSSITGLEIKGLAGVDAGAYDAWQDIRGPEDLQIKDTDSINLTAAGTERFFTGKKTTTEG
jgi:hypothetical protein